MSRYATRGAPPATLTSDEQQRILRVTGEHVRGFRDHLIIALALGAGLREHEIAALDVADVAPAVFGRGRRIQLRTFKGRARSGEETQEAWLTDELRRKLRQYLGDAGAAAGALFVSREGGRISTRQIRHLWAQWQGRAGFEKRFPFHALRHTFVSNVYRRSGSDVILAMRLARHRRIETTQVYAHASDDDVDRVVRGLPS